MKTATLKPMNRWTDAQILALARLRLRGVSRSNYKTTAPDLAAIIDDPEPRGWKSLENKWMNLGKGSRTTFKALQESAREMEEQRQTLNTSPSFEASLEAPQAPAPAPQAPAFAPRVDWSEAETSALYRIWEHRNFKKPQFGNIAQDCPQDYAIIAARGLKCIKSKFYSETFRKVARRMRALNRGEQVQEDGQEQQHQAPAGVAINYCPGCGQNLQIFTAAFALAAKMQARGGSNGTH